MFSNNNNNTLSLIYFFFPLLKGLLCIKKVKYYIRSYKMWKREPLIYENYTVTASRMKNIQTWIKLGRL